MNKDQFAAAVTELIAQGIDDRAERIEAVRTLTDKYISATGETPDTKQLERLADYILREELTSMDTHKVQHEEYPFLSEHQFDRRHRREVSLWVAENLGADGQDHKPKKKRMRSKWEHTFMDRGIRIDNRARKAQYRRDTAPGPVITTMSEPFVMARKQAARWRDSLSLVY
ncbi:hypothetical protein M6D81_11500 [Paenibacillus sp. J5C_2022]|uniref:hypothetical protein n=1 Tax=Paenibacillus sp. J5C2022 TaxID=2977129 RepID=UPI0021CF81DC|nr:hypothetical protein [Paenibacillus sp. J5C2022]MCU6709332.1 hypothetical protein [Paenibacillus sp. J5C2022]